MNANLRSKGSAMEIGDVVPLGSTPLESAYGNYLAFCQRLAIRPAEFARWLELDGKGIKYKLEHSQPKTTSKLYDTAPSQLAVHGS